MLEVACNVSLLPSGAILDLCMPCTLGLHTPVTWHMSHIRDLGRSTALWC